MDNITFEPSQTSAVALVVNGFAVAYNKADLSLDEWERAIHKKSEQYFSDGTVIPQPPVSYEYYHQKSYVLYNLDVVPAYAVNNRDWYSFYMQNLFSEKTIPLHDDYLAMYQKLQSATELSNSAALLHRAVVKHDGGLVPYHMNCGRVGQVDFDTAKMFGERSDVTVNITVSYRDELAVFESLQQAIELLQAGNNGFDEYEEQLFLDRDKQPQAAFSDGKMVTLPRGVDLAIIQRFADFKVYLEIYLVPIENNGKTVGWCMVLHVSHENEAQKECDWSDLVYHSSEYGIKDSNDVFVATIDMVNTMIENQLSWDEDCGY